MIRSITTLILSLLLFLGAKGQTSLNEKTAFWTTGSNWSGGVMPGTLSAGTITLTSLVVVINGTVKAVQNITAPGSNIHINVDDTLVMLGNLTLTGANFSNDGVVIVLGNVSSTGANASNSALGKMVVTGNYASSGGNNSFAGPSYVFGGFPGTGSATNLQNNDPLLYAYLQSMFAILPIELSYFAATVENGQVELTWETFSETNNDYFIIERSFDGIHYDVVRNVRGAGNSKNTLTYTVFDEYPLYGKSYYKLSQVDFDGKKSEFKAVSVFNDRKVQLQVYPNPTSDFLYLNCSGCNYSVTVRDANDRLRLHPASLIALEPGKSGIDLTSLDAGVYFIVVATPQTTLSTTYRIVKK